MWLVLILQILSMSIHSSANIEVSCGLYVLNLLVLQIYMVFQEKQDRVKVSVMQKFADFTKYH